MLTTTDAARELQITVARVKQLIAEGILPARKFGRSWMIQPRHLDQARKRPDGRGRPKKAG